MNRKTIIEIAVIVICFAGAGFVLYNGFFKGRSDPVPPGGAGGSAPGQSGAYASDADPLPFGDNLSGELARALARNGLQYNLFDYPEVSAAEVGIPANNFIKPLPALPAN